MSILKLDLYSFHDSITGSQLTVSSERALMCFFFQRQDVAVLHHARLVPWGLFLPVMISSPLFFLMVYFIKSGISMCTEETEMSHLFKSLLKYLHAASCKRHTSSKKSLKWRFMLHFNSVSSCSITYTAVPILIIHNNVEQVHLFLYSFSWLHRGNEQKIKQILCWLLICHRTDFIFKISTRINYSLIGHCCSFHWL